MLVSTCAGKKRRRKGGRGEEYEAFCTYNAVHVVLSNRLETFGRVLGVGRSEDTEHQGQDGEGGCEVTHADIYDLHVLQTLRSELRSLLS